MNEQNSNTQQGSGFAISDILFIVFRHKWKILLFAILGAVGAGVVWRIKQPPYQSNAKLLIRYVTDSRGLSPGGAAGSDVIRSPDTYGSTVVNSEIEILMSYDLALATV